MIKRLLYNEMCTGEYEAKMNQTEQEFWTICGEVYDELNEMPSSYLAS